MNRVNAHTHLYSGLVPIGMPAPEVAPENFLEILVQIWWRLDRALDEDSLRASAEYYVANALGLGCCGLIDHHESPNFIEGSLDVIAEVCQSMGMPAVLCYGATERNGGREEGKRGLAECARFIRENDRPLAKGAIGLHASFTVSDDTIREAGELARELDTVLHVHVAEDTADVADAGDRGFAGLIDRFAKCGAMESGSIFAHGIHLTAPEVEACADAGIWLVQNPRSNRGNKVGYPTALAESTLVALGTDGYEADMGAEAAALRADAEAAGEHMSAVSMRSDASAILLETFWDGVQPNCGATPSEDALREITASAEKQAALLWQRMSEYK
ncbi:MAG: amidohydrolase family protein [Myxococcales bacterium]|nr:amidohydrolase family protein [Myxococcales bacterium]